MDDKLAQIQTYINQATNEINAYNVKPSKATSKRIRLALGEIKKLVTPVRAQLVAEDKTR
jgi:hypothetical protein